MVGTVGLADDTARRPGAESMVGGIIGRVLPYAVACNLSPLALMALIVLLFSPRARRNGSLFLCVWGGTLTIGVGLVDVLAGLIARAPSAVLGTGGAYLRLLLGIVLLGLAFRGAIDRPPRRAGGGPDVPRWMAGASALGPRGVMGIALLVAAVGNVPWILAAGVDIGRAELAPGPTLLAILLFAAIGSAAVGLVVLYYLLRQRSAAVTLQIWQRWLSLQDRAVTRAVFVVFGALLLAQGVAGLRPLG